MLTAVRFMNYGVFPVQRIRVFRIHIPDINMPSARIETR